MKSTRVLLIIVAVVCMAIAASYPIMHFMQRQNNENEMEELSSMRVRVLEDLGESEHIPSQLRNTADPSATSVHNTGTPAPNTVAPEAYVIPVEVKSFDADNVTQTEPESTPYILSDRYLLQGADLVVVTDAPTQIPEPTYGPATDAPTDLAQEPTERPTAAMLTLPTRVPDGYRATAEPTLPPLSVATADTDIAPQTTKQAGEAYYQTETFGPSITGDFANVTGHMTPLPAMTGSPNVPTSMPTAQETLIPISTPLPDIFDYIIEGVYMFTPTPAPTPRASKTPLTFAAAPTLRPDRYVRRYALAYTEKEKIELDKNLILPELRELYRINSDLVGWIYIDDTNIDFPVVQADNGDYYLTHDFTGNENSNGQIILDPKCDPYTPSYNLIISGHHMNSGAMFGRLPEYKNEEYWETHKIVEFDNLMERNKYVIFAVFYSADYDEDEEGFRYNADIRFKIDADQWLAEIRENQIYDTGIDAQFGDEFITLTTCDRSRRRTGRFVAVARKLREGEIIE